MIEYPKCLYRYPAQTTTTVDIEGLVFDYSFAADENAELAAVAGGWATVPTIPVAELAEPAVDAAGPVSRDELEARAKAAGLKLRKNISDKELALAVMEAEAA